MVNFRKSSLLKKIIASFALAVIIASIPGIIALVSLNNVSSSSSFVIDEKIPLQISSLKAVEMLAEVNLDILKYISETESLDEIKEKIKHDLSELRVRMKEIQTTVHDPKLSKSINHLLKTTVPSYEKELQHLLDIHEEKSSYYFTFEGKKYSLNIFAARQFIGFRKWVENLEKSVEYGVPFTGITDGNKTEFTKWSKTFKTGHKKIAKAIKKIDSFTNRIYRISGEISAASAEKRKAIYKVQADTDFRRYEKSLSKLNTYSNAAFDEIKKKEDDTFNKLSILAEEIREDLIHVLDSVDKEVITAKTDAENTANTAIILTIIVILAAVIISISLLWFVSVTMKSMVSSFEKNVSAVIETVSASATQMNQTSISMSNVISNVVDKAKNVSNESNEMSSNVSAVAASGEEMASTSTEITTQIEQSMIVVGSAVAEVEKADATSQELDSSAASIGELVKLIQGIAEQTNLLALNAAIESARAGDAGKGFAVVADEVKKLASQTASATNDISEQIKCIQGVSKQVVTALGSIKEAIEGVEQNSVTISGAVTEQTIATTDISSNMTIAAQSTGKITSDIGEVEVAASEAGESATEVLDVAVVLSEESTKLAEQVKKFLLELR